MKEQVQYDSFYMSSRITKLIYGDKTRTVFAQGVRRKGREIDWQGTLTATAKSEHILTSNQINIKPYTKGLYLNSFYLIHHV